MSSEIGKNEDSTAYTMVSDFKQKETNNFSMAVQGQRGQGSGQGSFKKNRLVRMFESEINWLDAYFGDSSVTVEDYVQHDNR